MAGIVRGRPETAREFFGFELPQRPSFVGCVRVPVQLIRSFHLQCHGTSPPITIDLENDGAVSSPEGSVTLGPFLRYGREPILVAILD